MWVGGWVETCIEEWCEIIGLERRNTEREGKKKKQATCEATQHNPLFFLSYLFLFSSHPIHKTCIYTRVCLTHCTGKTCAAPY